ncbi:MAG: hypothetical protein IJO91_02825 [Oscillospiraceae bacterium]|nr:hypothetical protein [Oscillospiraceae bacterium]
MYDTITALYNGNLEPGARIYCNTAEYALLASERERLVEALRAGLDGQRLQLLEKLCEVTESMSCEQERASFIEGFCLGVRIAAEAFQ